MILWIKEFDRTIPLRENRDLQKFSLMQLFGVHEKRGQCHEIWLFLSKVVSTVILYLIILMTLIITAQNRHCTVLIVIYITKAANKFLLRKCTVHCTNMSLCPKYSRERAVCQVSFNLQKYIFLVSGGCGDSVLSCSLAVT